MSKRNRKIRILLGSALVLCCQLGHSQIRYGLSLNAGLSNLFELNQSYMYDEKGYRIKDLFEYNSVNFCTYSSAFAIEGFIIEPLKQSRYSLEQGLMFESISYYFNTPEVIFTNDTIHANKWEERFLSVGIPLKMRYGFEKWLVFYVGVNNIFHVYDNNETVLSEPVIYTLRGEVGADFILFSKLILGAKYAHDITPFSKLTDFDVSYRFEIISLKLGYCF